jgi:glutamine synthetase
MSKLLLAVAVAQTALLGLVAAKVVGLEARIEGLGAASRAFASTSDRAPAATVFAGPTTADLRTVIREEIAAAKTSISGAPRMSAIEACAPARRVEGRDEDGAADPNAVSLVRAQLNAHIARGRMSAKEMDAFYNQIAELSPEDRRFMLRDLTSAMNSGKLDARM